MEECHELGLVKFDILGLKSVGVIDKAFKLVGKSFPKAYQIDWNDQKVFEDISNDSTSIFQFESQFAHDSIKKMQPRSIDDLSLCSACLRPSGMSYRDAVFNHEVHKNPSELIDNVLSNSYGYLVYQEQTIAFLQQACGLSGSEADTMRRCVDENTLITMANGKRKPIKDIKVDEQVMTLDEDKGIFTYNTVNKVYDNGIQDVIEISTKHEHSIKMTKHHKVLTQRGWIEAGELTIDDYMMLPLRNHGYQDKKRPNERLSNTDMFLIGMLLGDGTIGGQKSDLHFTNSDITLIEKFKDCVNKRLRGNRESEFKIFTQNGVTVEYIYTIRIVSENYRNSVWDNLICKNGINCKSANKHISDDLMNYPCGEKLSNLLGGLFSTDGGYVTNAKCFEYYTTSKELAYDIQFLLGKYNIYSYVYSANVKGYDCINYKVRISQKDAVDNFVKEIIPFMCGNKYNEFMQIINDRKNESSQTGIRYNYLLPRIYLDEIRQNADFKHMSMRSMGFNGGTNAYNSFSDVKIKKVLNYLYVPKTYKLLMSEYMPIKITNIKACGQSHVYDLEIDTNHNYIAEGLIVHNCIAKKQQDKVQIMLPRIIDGYCNNSNKPREIAENEVKEFIQVISDASGYQFGFNHSESYSMLSYLMGYLRYYYPTEYCTSYLNCAKNDDDLINGTALAKNKGCKIVNPKFRMSTSEYGCDGSIKTIYKGIGSIKDIGSETGDKLYALKDNHYPTFIDLLKDIDANKCCNSRELDILIRIDYFSEFGNPNQLLEIVKLYNKFGSVKVLTKSKLTSQELEIASKYAHKATEKQLREIDTNGLLNELIGAIKASTDPLQQICYDVTYLGYTNRTYDAPYYAVTGLETNNYGTTYISLYNIQDGSNESYKLSRKWDIECEQGDILEVSFEDKHKHTKDDNGNWVKTDVIEKRIKLFNVILKNPKTK